MRRGFTILELVVVVVLISMIAAVTIPSFFRNADVTLENAAVLLARDLRAAQNRSAYLATPCRFTFLSNGDGYEVYDEEGALIINPRSGEKFVRHYSEDGVFSGVEVIEVVGDDGRRLTFDDHGRAKGSIQATLSFGGDIRVVVVERGTGSTRILGSSTGWRDPGE